MNVLVDTNVLGRMAEPGHAQHRVAVDAVAALIRRGDSPCLVPQVLYEFWVVATRSLGGKRAGVGPEPGGCGGIALGGLHPLLLDGPAIYPEWKRLVATHLVLGKNAHDVRLVAAMLVHGVTHLLTFNVADFSRFHGITVLNPAAVATPPTP